MNLYRDNNNFIVFNKVTAQDNRFLLFLRNNYFEFLSVLKEAPWTSSTYVRVHSTTTNGKDYYLESNQIYFGTYFFLSEIKLEHERKLQNVMDLISQIGGLFASLIAFFGYLGASLNN